MFGSQPRIGLFDVCKSLNTCPWSVQAHLHEVIKDQVQNFSAPLKMTISQPRRGPFEVCKSLNTCPVSGEWMG